VFKSSHQQWYSDTHTAGEDLGHCPHLINSFKKQIGIDLSKDQMAIYCIHQAVEKAKIELWSISQMDINPPFTSSSASGTQHINEKLMHSQFESITASLSYGTLSTLARKHSMMLAW
jgi:molecular chaperone DnaK